MVLEVGRLMTEMSLYFIEARLRAVSFFSVVRRAKRETRNGHARDWWRKTGEALVSRVSRLRRSRIALTKSEEKERLLAV